MKVSMSWLKDFVDIDVPVQELADRLVSAGFEVEEIIDKSAEIRNVVLGKIVKMTHHPDADKLWICLVDIGEEAPVQIVTGAQNLTEGDLVPAALDDSYLPGGKHIKTGKLRGVDSYGMLCSGEELGLTESDYKGAGVYGILVMNKETAPLGTDINEVLGNDDIILDIGVTANRSDCNSVLGIAREVSAVLGKLQVLRRQGRRQDLRQGRDSGIVPEIYGSGGQRRQDRSFRRRDRKEAAQRGIAPDQQHRRHHQLCADRDRAADARI